MLEKLQPSTIVLDPEQIGMIDPASRKIKDEERKEELAAFMEKKSKKRKRNKMRGRGTAENETRSKTR